jgi:cytochrome c551/c552
MKKFLSLVALLSFALVVGCAGNEEKNEGSFVIKGKSETSSSTNDKNQNILASKKIDLKNKGIGPIKSLNLESEIDQNMVTHGAKLYKNKCASCHRTDKKFIGPASAGIMNRRTPEWIMNKMLNPLKMIQEDHLTKELVKEFNYAIMPDQSLEEHEARAVLEYFRTLN